MASSDAAASGESPDGASSKYHRAPGGGSGMEATVESVGRPRATLLRVVQSLATPFAGSGRAHSGSLMVGQMTVNFFSESCEDSKEDGLCLFDGELVEPPVKLEIHVNKASTKHEDLINSIADPELLSDSELTMFPGKQVSIFSRGGSFFKGLLSRKTLPVEDISSFSGDFDYPANTARLDRSFEEFSATVRYEAALARVQAGILREKRKAGLRQFMGPSRLLLRRIYYRQKVEKDILELTKRIANMEKLLQKLDGSTAKGFEDLRLGIKELSLKCKQSIDDGLAAIEKASGKDQAAIDAAFDELKAKLDSVGKDLATLANYAEKASKSAGGSWLQRLTWSKVLHYASSTSTLAWNIANFIRDKKPEPSPAPPAPEPPCPSPDLEEEQPVVEPPPSVPTTPAFYKSIGRHSKGLLHNGFDLRPFFASKLKVPFGPDDKSDVALCVCTDNAEVACKVAVDGLFEDKLKLSFIAGIGGFKPKGKLFYSFPFAGVNGHLNASVALGASPDLKMALTLEKHGLVAGGKVVLDPFTKRLKSQEVGISYGPGSLKIVDGDMLKLSLYEGWLSQAVAGGLELTYSRSKEEAAVCGAVCVKLGDNTTIKSKVDSTGAVTAAVRHCLSAGFVAGACAQVKMGEEARFGFSIRSRMGVDD